MLMAEQNGRNAAPIQQACRMDSAEVEETICSIKIL